MFSTTTIALSTSMPSARIRANSTIMLTWNSMRLSTINDRNIDNGIASPTNRAFLVPRNRNSTTITKIILIIMLFSRLCSCFSTNADWSFVMVTLRSSGKRFSCWASVRMFFIFFVAERRFSPPFFTTCRETTGCPLSLV